MAFERLLNYLSTTVGGSGYTSGGSALDVASTSAFSGTGNYRIGVTDATTGALKAIFQVTAINSATQFATTAEVDASCAVGDIVSLVQSAGSQTQIWAEMLTYGTFASLPASGARAGHTYWFTNSLYSHAIWDGSTWHYFYPGAGEVTPPPSSGWSWDNQDSATIDSTNGYEYFVSPRGTGSVKLTGRYRTAPSAPYSFEFGFLHQGVSASADGPGTGETGVLIGFRDGSNKLVTLIWEFSGGVPTLGLHKWTSSTTYSAPYTGADSGAAMMDTVVQSPLYGRITDDNANIIASISLDRQHWVDLFTETRTDFLASGPTQICYGCYHNNFGQRIALFHLKQT